MFHFHRAIVHKKVHTIYLKMFITENKRMTNSKNCSLKIGVAVRVATGIKMFCKCRHLNEPRREKTFFFWICENKDADQFRGNREADQHLCFRYIDSTIPLLHIYEISSLYPSFVVIQPSLCRSWSETPKTGFLTRRLKLFIVPCINSVGGEYTSSDYLHVSRFYLIPFY